MIKLNAYMYTDCVWSLICAKNTTFVVSFYLRILPLPISNIHLQPSVIRFHPLSAVRNPQSAFAHPLSTLGLICAKNTTFAVSFYLCILPSPILNIHLQPSVIRFHLLSAVCNPHLPVRFRLLAQCARYRVNQIDAGTAASHTKGGRCACG